MSLSDLARSLEQKHLQASNTPLRERLNQAGTPPCADGVWAVNELHGRFLFSHVEDLKLSFLTPLGSAQPIWYWNYCIWFDKEQVAENLDCSIRRLNHSVERMLGVNYPHKKKRKEPNKPGVFEPNLKGKKPIIFLEGRWGVHKLVVEEVIKDLAFRYPRLPEAIAWYKNFNDHRPDLGTRVTSIKRDILLR